MTEAQRREMFGTSSLIKKASVLGVLPGQTRRVAGSTGVASCRAEVERRVAGETEFRTRAAQRTTDSRREAAKVRAETSELRAGTRLLPAIAS
jgi:hypothetical protein